MQQMTNATNGPLIILLTYIKIKVWKVGYELVGRIKWQKVGKRKNK
jgi:hypothetical protein